MRAFLILVALAAALPALSALAATAHAEPVDWGPLTVRSHAILFQNRLSYTPGRVQTLAPGVAELNLGINRANLWAQMPGYFFDGEWTRLSLRGHLGLQGGWELEAELAFYDRRGGVMDGLIQAFHRLTHVTQARRLDYPINRLRVETYDSHGRRTWLTDADAGMGVGNPTVGVKKRLCVDACAGWPVLTGELVLKVPVGDIDRLFASRGVAGMLDLALQQPLGTAFQLYAAMGLIVSPTVHHIYGMQLSQLQKFVLAAVEWRLARPLSIVFHYLNQDGTVELATYSPLNSTTHEFVLGVKWAPGDTDNLLLELGVIENTVHDANTPDFGVHAAVRWRLQ